MLNYASTIDCGMRAFSRLEKVVFLRGGVSLGQVDGVRACERRPGQSAEFTARRRR
jgi:hypothetical protein